MDLDQGLLERYTSNQKSAEDQDHIERMAFSPGADTPHAARMDLGVGIQALGVHHHRTIGAEAVILACHSVDIVIVGAADFLWVLWLQRPASE